MILSSSSRITSDRFVKPGYTLLELMITSVLGAVLLLGASAMFLVFMSGNAKTNVRRQINAEGQRVMSSFEYQLRNASKVSATDCVDALSNRLTYIDLAGNPHTFEVLSGVSYLDNAPLHSTFVTISDNPFRCSQNSTSGKQQVAISFILRKATDANLFQQFEATINVRNTGLR